MRIQYTEGSFDYAIDKMESGEFEIIPPVDDCLYSSGSARPMFRQSSPLRIGGLTIDHIAAHVRDTQKEMSNARAALKEALEIIEKIDLDAERNYEIEGSHYHNGARRSSGNALRAIKRAIAKNEVAL